MKKTLLSIGQMAKINHVTIPTLRLYDKMGLLSPRHVDKFSSYRYYDLQQNARLDMIAYMKELGMSLHEIKTALEKEDVSIIEGLLAQKNEQLHEQMREIKIRHNAVERAIQSIERYRKSPTTGTTSLEYIDRRYIFSIPCTDNFYEGGIEAYEEALTHLRRALMENDFKHIHSYNIGTSITNGAFEKGCFMPDKLFVFIDKTEYQTHKGQTLDSGMYACIYVDQYDDELPCAQKLLDFCNQNGYKISGSYICEVMTEFNVFSQEKRSMFLRLQVPVSFL